jgi:hypothetical protein
MVSKQEVREKYPILAAVCEDGISRMDGDTLVVKILDGSWSNLVLPVPRPKHVRVIRYTAPSGPDGDERMVNKVERLRSWEEFIISNREYIKLSPGTKKDDLSMVELQAIRSSTLENLYLPHSVDWNEVEYVFGKSDPDLESLKKKLASRRKELERMAWSVDPDGTITQMGQVDWDGLYDDHSELKDGCTADELIEAYLPGKEKS